MPANHSAPTPQSVRQEIEAEQDAKQSLLRDLEKLASLGGDAAVTAFEERVLRQPFELKVWFGYLEVLDTPKQRYEIYERALSYLPGSYKLWYAYIRERKEKVRGLPIDSPAYDAMNDVFDRAIVFMNKMPVIWLMYCDFIVDQRLVTRARRTFDNALRSLPVTQHYRVWEKYLSFVEQEWVPHVTAIRVYRRYLKLEPNHVERFIAYLKKIGQLDRAACLLHDNLNRENFVSCEGKTRHQLWYELCELIADHPEQVKSLRIEPIIRGGIKKFTDEVGKLWCSLADYYVKRGHFESAREIYEEGMATVTTVRDFSLIFDAYNKFGETLLTAKTAAADDLALQSTKATSEAERTQIECDAEDMMLDIDLMLSRMEDLNSRRALLVSSVNLRQNPHNVHEWHKRVKLFDDPAKVCEAYAEAVRTVEPERAIGKPHSLWCNFAKYYEKHNALNDARAIFERATSANFRQPDELASVWCEWAEMEIRHKNFKKALEVMRKAIRNALNAADSVKRKPRGGPVTQEDFRYDYKQKPVQTKLVRSTKLWSFYVDLEESLGTLQSTKGVYEQMMEIRVATPQHILNFAALMEEHKYYEESFKVFEKGVAAFPFPHAAAIWTKYLNKFIERYGGRKLERARDLFEQVLEKVPPEQAKEFYLMYATMEEKYGLAKRSMSIYDRATDKVPDSDKLSVYRVYISKVAEFFGVTKTREVYEKAIEKLNDVDSKEMCLRYAELERQLGEIDRARAIFIHASQFADPRVDAEFWKKWHEFEVQHGNEETFREMLRIKRSIMAKYTTVRFGGKPSEVIGGTVAPSDAMAQVEATEESSTGDVSMGGVGAPPEPLRAPTAEGESMGALARFRKAGVQA
eukprot:Rmarinus@m.28163